MKTLTQAFADGIEGVTAISKGVEGVGLVSNGFDKPVVPGLTMEGWD